VPWSNLAAYGLLIGGGLFGLLYIGMNGHITPGLASLVVQAQVFFTIALAAYLNAERVRPFHIVALVVAVGGLAVIAMHTDRSTTALGLALVLAGAFCWAVSNVVARSAPNVDMLAYVVWASLFSVPPLLAASFAFEGWPVIRDSLIHASASTCAPSFINRLATPYSDMRSGVGCWRVIPLSRSLRCRCWCQYLASALRPYGSASLCKTGNWKRSGSSWRAYALISWGRN
jgi:threonine/homoserine efflux transporter RhtA